MAGEEFVTWIASFFLDVYPNPIFWGLACLTVYIVYLVLKRVPNSAIAHLGFIFILGLASVLGGVFEVLRGFLFAGAGAFFLLGLWQFIGRR